MKVNIKGHIRDLLAFRRLVPNRRRRIARSGNAPVEPAAMNVLARQLHPERQQLRVAEIRDETATCKSFRLVPDVDAGTGRLAYFRAGQYLSLKVQVNDVWITRPYSISSAPFESLGPDGYYEITVRRKSDGFLTTHIWTNWQVGTRLQSSGPCGFFYHEPLRDSHKIVGLAGGSGITPFRCMAREIVHGGMDAELLLIYGSSDQDDILFYDELEELAGRAPDKIRVVHVLSCQEATLPGCEQGFITADIIAKYADLGGSSFFICGPPIMYRFVEEELAALNLPLRRIRREGYGEPEDVTIYPGFPSHLAGETFQVTVHMGGITTQVPAQASETLLVALERADLAPPSQCRSAECGFCRAHLIQGDAFIIPDPDGRRAADKEFGYLHLCAAYPVSDLELGVARGP
jgi:ferredoxin-NADP reductase